MSQQAAAGQGSPAGGRAGRGGRFFRGRGDPPSKGFKSSISKIATDMFNTGQNRFAAQFTQSRKNLANYLQRTASDEGYLVTETVRTEKEQRIALPPAVNVNAADAANQLIIQEEAVRAIAKRISDGGGLAFIQRGTRGGQGQGTGRGAGAELDKELQQEMQAEEAPTMEQVPPQPGQEPTALERATATTAEMRDTGQGNARFSRKNNKSNYTW